MDAMHQPDWSYISGEDISQINKPQVEKKGRIVIQLMLSPLDIPVAVRAFDSEQGNHVLEFKYLTSTEDKKNVKPARGVTLLMGKNSKRLYSVTLEPQVLCDNDKGEASVELRFLMAADEAIKDMKTNGAIKQGNADAIHRMLKPNSPVFHNNFSQFAWG